MNDFIIKKKLLINESKLMNIERLKSQVLKVAKRICDGWETINVSLMPNTEKGKAFLLLTNFDYDSGDVLDLSFDEESE